MLEEELVLLGGERLAELRQLLVEDAPQLLAREPLVDRLGGLRQPIALRLPRLVVARAGGSVERELVVAEPLVHLAHVLLAHLQLFRQQRRLRLEALPEKPLLLFAQIEEQLEVSE